MNAQGIIAALQSATADHAAGQLGELELIAISLAANDLLRESQVNPQTTKAYAAFADFAEARLLERAAEINRGDA